MRRASPANVRLFVGETSQFAFSSSPLCTITQRLVFSPFSSELPSKLSFLANFVNHIYFITFSSIPFLYKIPRKVSWERRKSLKFDFHTDSFPYFILFRKKRNNRTDQSVTNHVLSPRSVCLRGVERSDPRFDICV